MRNRTSLVLMEQLIMVLVFALAAALCLQVFSRADQISKETGRRDRAVTLVQNAAETVKACSGNPQETAELLGGSLKAQQLLVGYDDQWNRTEETADCEYLLEIRWMDAGTAGLGQAVISVYPEGAPQELLFILMVAWQEVA